MSVANDELCLLVMCLSRCTLDTQVLFSAFQWSPQDIAWHPVGSFISLYAC